VRETARLLDSGFAAGHVAGFVGQLNLSLVETTTLQQAAAVATQVRPYLSPEVASKLQLALAVIDMRSAVLAQDWSKAGVVSGSICLMVRSTSVHL
jgi:hypothetical protein